MAKYLGEKILNIEDTEFKNYSPSDWTMYYIERYGQIDGAHHKQWVLDQIARILLGNKIIIKQASWDDGNKEYRIQLDKPTKNYKQWVKEMKDGEDGPETYGYEEGIAP